MVNCTVVSNKQKVVKVHLTKHIFLIESTNMAVCDIWHVCLKIHHVNMLHNYRDLYNMIPMQWNECHYCGSITKSLFKIYCTCIDFLI